MPPKAQPAKPTQGGTGVSATVIGYSNSDRTNFNRSTTNRK